jgi:hypothetical protein
MIGLGVIVLVSAVWFYFVPTVLTKIAWVLPVQ